MFNRIILIAAFNLATLPVLCQEIKISNTFSATGRNGYFKWTIFIDESPAILNTIDHVEYLLGPTFPDPEVSIYDKDHNFNYTGTGWAEFEIKVKIVFKDKQKPFAYYDHWVRLK